MNKQTPEKNTSDGEKSLVIYKVLRTIITSGVSPIPRNYELFYEFLSGMNKSLARELLSLPHNPDQKLLDKIGAKYNLPGFSKVAARSVALHQSDIVTQLNVKLLKSVKQLDAAYKACTELKEPAPNLLQALTEIRSEHQELQRLLNKEADRLDSVDTEEDAISPIATRDTLTGLPNRLLFTEKMAELYPEGKPCTPASLILCNIDHLRFLNDQFGMTEVNKCICRLALMIKRRVKSRDLVSRISGNEFAILIDNVPQHVAIHIGERLRLATQKIRLSAHARFTLSIGVADNQQTASAQEFYAKAELALLSSRTGKRNCVTIYDKEVAMRSRQAYLMHLKAESRALRTLA